MNGGIVYVLSILGKYGGSTGFSAKMEMQYDEIFGIGEVLLKLYTSGSLPTSSEG